MGHYKDSYRGYNPTPAKKPIMNKIMSTMKNIPSPAILVALLLLAISFGSERNNTDPELVEVTVVKNCRFDKGVFEGVVHAYILEVTETKQRVITEWYFGEEGDTFCISSDYLVGYVPSPKKEYIKLD